MSIDRMLALREKPAGRPLMHQSWHSLTFLHWSYPPEVIQALLPPGMTVDVWEGRAYVGVVPFKMVNVRFARGFSVVGAKNFPETNVRTYVIGPNGEPGVWFFSLDATSPHAAAGGRLLYGLPYHFASMSVSVSPTEAAYRSHRRAVESHIVTQLQPQATPSEPGSHEFWLAERYLLFSRRRGRFWSGQVHHKPYPLSPVTVEVHQNTMLAPLGLESSSTPIAHYSPGVDVDVYRLQPVEL